MNEETKKEIIDLLNESKILINVTQNCIEKIIAEKAMLQESFLYMFNCIKDYHSNEVILDILIKEINRKVLEIEGE